jgi:Histone H1-like protein Hc1.
MQNLVNQLKADVEAFITDANAQIEKSNKAAGARARKVSLAIEKQMKEFRKKSLEAGK